MVSTAVSSSFSRLFDCSGEEGGDRDRAAAGGVGAAEWVDDILASVRNWVVGLNLLKQCLVELSIRGPGSQHSADKISDQGLGPEPEPDPLALWLARARVSVRSALCVGPSARQGSHYSQQNREPDQIVLQPPSHFQLTSDRLSLSPESPSPLATRSPFAHTTMPPSASSTAAKRIAREIKALDEPDSLPQGCKYVRRDCGSQGERIISADTSSRRAGPSDDNIYEWTAQIGKRAFPPGQNGDMS